MKQLETNEEEEKRRKTSNARMNSTEPINSN